MIGSLKAVDQDLSRAVVRVAQGNTAAPVRPVELSSFGKRSVIVVSSSRTLEERTGVILVPLSGGRALIAFDESMTPARLELMIQDALEDQQLGSGDCAIFAGIRDLLKDVRRSPSLSLRRRQIMVVESSQDDRRASTPGRHRLRHRLKES